MMKMQIDDKWIREIYKDGLKEFTFCGALEYRYRHVAKNWNADTRKKHEREYNNIILPALENHNDKSIREYTREDYENAIETIRENGYVKDGVRRQYSESSINNFQNLIYYVVFQAAVYGLCDNVLWGTKFVLDIPNEEDELEERVILKKSLSIEQEKLFARAVMSDPSEDGETVALLLMWGLGLRNAEACGLNYGDIKQLEGHSDCYCAWVYKTTKIKSNELQSGGKTYNTGRIIPVPGKILEFLNERKKLLYSVIRKLNQEEFNIDELPICSKGWIDFENTNYSERCRADRVSMAAHDIFENVGITSKQIAFLDEELSDGKTSAALKEKDPTAYLLRRNFATQMCILGLNNSEMQYLIGHDVEDAYESRNEYVDSERIYAMWLKLRQRELVNDRIYDYNKAEICIKATETVKIHISAIEPEEGINVKVDADENASVNMYWCEETKKQTTERSINILDSYHQQYDQ